MPKKSNPCQFFEVGSTELQRRINNNPRFSFTPGKKYIFSEAHPGLGGTKNPMHNLQYIFIYIKQVNKIHVFREANLGWLRGIADNQLIGKTIREVN